MGVQRIMRVAIAAGGLALVLGSIASRVPAQTPHAVNLRPSLRERPLPIDRGSAALWQSLLKLHTRASMLMITAHPDDEDGGLLAYESRGQGARVALLTLNRGEAGQNLMTSDYFDAMGLLRTEELLAADRYYGVQQYFTRVIDFGFSKSKEETMQKWTHERVLYDVVRAVRIVRPLVLTSVFVGTYSDGHGNHQVAGQVAQEVFKDAGDPNVFPDQIRAGLRPWAPLKDYARVPTFAVRDRQIWDYADGHTYPLRFYNYITGRWIDGQLATDLTIPEGQYDPLLGDSFFQIGREGLGYQKSQNGGIAVPPPGPANSDDHLFGSRVSAPARADSMFAGIDVSLTGIADLAAGQNSQFLKTGLESMNRDVEQAMKQFDARHPETIAPLLAAGAKANLALIDQVGSSRLTPDAKYNVLHELRIKQAQFNAALAESLGIVVQSTVTPAHVPAGPFARFFGPPNTFRVAIPGQTFYLNVRAADQGRLPVAIRRVWVETPTGKSWTVLAEGPVPSSVDAGRDASERFRVAVSENAAFTRPYFSRRNLRQAYYDIDDPKYLNLPFAPYPVSGWMEFEYDGVPVRLGRVAQTLRRELGFGQVAEPLVIGPAISLWLSPHAGVVPLAAKSFPVTVFLHSNAEGPAKGTVRLNLPPGWESTPASAAFSVARDGEDLKLRFEVRPTRVQARPYRLRVVATCDDREFREGYRKIGYPGLLPYFLYRPAHYEATGVDVKIAPDLKVGYVVGTGDEVPQSLEDLGVRTAFLSPENIASADLSKFDAIVVGERAYSVRPELATDNQRLLSYVYRGGVLIVQYQAGDYDHNYGPYPLTLGRGQTVTDEDSKVQFLLPNDPALLWPNKIGERDFRGWIEERGHGFPESWDQHWQAPLEMHDQGQPPQKGGLLVARYGKGEYVYVALALYRQLPEGVPGSYRIFANLLSLGRNPMLGSRESSSGSSRSRGLSPASADPGILK